MCGKLYGSVWKCMDKLYGSVWKCMDKLYGSVWIFLVNDFLYGKRYEN
jgi:hypothetical protein